MPVLKTKSLKSKLMQLAGKKKELAETSCFAGKDWFLSVGWRTKIRVLADVDMRNMKKSARVKRRKKSKKAIDQPDLAIHRFDYVRRASD
jgi:hypothetical protein